jgi:hypothetical protein
MFEAIDEGIAIIPGIARHAVAAGGLAVAAHVHVLGDDGARPGRAALPLVPEPLSMRCHGLSSGALGGRLMGFANFRADPSIRLGTSIAA